MPADRPRNELEGEGIPKSIILALLMTRMLMMVTSDRWRRLAMKTGDEDGNISVQYQTCWFVCNWIINEAVPPESAFYIPEERHAAVVKASWGSRTTVVYQYYNPVTVVCKSWIHHAIRGGVVRRSYGGPFNQSWRSHAEVVSCDRCTQSIIKVMEQSACFGRGGFTERRVTGVLGSVVILKNIINIRQTSLKLANKRSRTWIVSINNVVTCRLSRLWRLIVKKKDKLINWAIYLKYPHQSAETLALELT